MIVKVCGVRSERDALAAAEAGADMLGFNFHAPSPRYVTPVAATRIAGALRKQAPDVVLVGVFVNMTSAAMGRIMDDCALDLAQLSGDEPPEVIWELSGRAFKAMRSGQPDIAAFARESPPALLLDAGAEGMYGGTGKLADWVTASELAARLPLLLAGGLTPVNVRRAVDTVHPWGVDVASGVESSPGVKDVAKMRAFVRAARDFSRPAELPVPPDEMLR